MSRQELSASPSARLITLTSTLIILHITKTSSNNCLLLYFELLIYIFTIKNPNNLKIQISKYKISIGNAKSLALF